MPFKLIFLKYIFECIINTVPLTSNSIHGKEKCFKYNNFSITIIQWLRGAVVKDIISLTGDSEGASLNSSEAIIFNFVHFFLFSFFIIFFIFFSFGLFYFIFTADPLKLYEDFVITYF